MGFERTRAFIGAAGSMGIISSAAALNKKFTETTGNTFMEGETEYAMSALLAIAAYIFIDSCMRLSRAESQKGS